MQKLFNHSFYKYLLRAYDVSGAVLGAGITAFNKANITALQEPML